LSRTTNPTNSAGDFLQGDVMEEPRSKCLSGAEGCKKLPRQVKEVGGGGGLTMLGIRAFTEAMKLEI